jgi:hypothetical protein
MPPNNAFGRIQSKRMNANSLKSFRRCSVERGLLLVVTLSLLSAACQTTNGSLTIDRHQGSSMDSGRYNWTYTLTWDGSRDSWFISNYGAG